MALAANPHYSRGRLLRSLRGAVLPTPPSNLIDQPIWSLLPPVIHNPRLSPASVKGQHLD